MAEICVVTQDIRLTGGVFTKLMAFLRFAESRGHTCDVYYPAEGPGSEDQSRLVRAVGSVRQVHAIPGTQLLPHVGRAALFGRRCRLDQRYDAHQLVAAWLSTGLPFVRSGHPFVAWVAGTSKAELGSVSRTKPRHFYLYNALTKRQLSRQESRAGKAAQLILADSRYSADNVRTHLGIPAAKIEVLPNPVDLDEFRPGELKPGAAPNVLSVSRLMRGKGFDTLIRAFELVAAKVPGIELHIVGDGGERQSLQGLAETLGVGPRVVFRGELRGQDLVSAYQRSALFALASHQEGLPTVVLEAMACGLPVVSTDCGGPADHVVPGVTGFLTPIGDPVELAARIAELLAQPDRAARMGANARRRAEETFGVEVINRRLDAVYEGILSRRGPEAAA